MNPIVDHKQKAQVPVPVNSKGLPAGVLVDTGTMRRIPFAIRYDLESGWYEYQVPAPNEVDVMVDPLTRKPIIRRCKAVGKLVLEPMNKADKLGVAPPKKVEATVQPMTKDERIAGMEQYKRLFFDVWSWRGDSKRIVANRWDDFLMDSPFLDEFCLRRRQG